MTAGPSNLAYFCVFYPSTPFTLRADNPCLVLEEQRSGQRKVGNPWQVLFGILKKKAFLGEGVPAPPA